MSTIKDNQALAKQYIDKEIRRRLPYSIEISPSRWVEEQINYYEAKSYRHTDYTNEVLSLLKEIARSTESYNQYLEKDLMLLLLNKL